MINLFLFVLVKLSKISIGISSITRTRIIPSIDYCIS